MFQRYLPLIVVATSLSALPITAAALAATTPSYETPELRITPRSAVLVDHGRQLHIVVVVENKLAKSIQVGISSRQDQTYAFDDLGGKWTLGDAPTGMQSTFDACNGGTPLGPGEARPVLFRLLNTPEGARAFLTFGTILYQCVDDEGRQVPVSIDGIHVDPTSNGESK